MITSRNRLDELQRTLPVIYSLKPAPIEVLLTADGCTDDTVKYVKKTFPQVRLIENKKNIGSVASRANMMNMARGDIVLALDDDSYPEQEDFIEKLIELFESNEKLAVATFPQRTDEYPETLSQTNFGKEHLIRSFANSGAGLRISTYRSLAGFEPMFFHMYEEPDYALQCVSSNWEVRYFPQLSIRHHWTKRERSERNNHHRHARNELWSTILRCPFPFCIVLIIYRIFTQAKFAASRGISWLIHEPVWWLGALKGFPNVLKRRKPVLWTEYKRWLSLPDR